jgi:uncharacterized protein DUF547
MPNPFRRIVLNAADATGAPPRGAEAAEALQQHALDALAAHTDARGRVDYRALRASAAFAEVRAAAATLRRVDLERVRERRAALAFWINVYNGLVIHAIVGLDIRRTVHDVWNFFGRASYVVGGVMLSLDEIEHGILRDNRRRPFPPWRAFGARDARRTLGVMPPDPRFHFAITCGAASCPPVGVYRTATIDAQLTLAARNFVNTEVTLDAAGRVVCSRLFKWYRADFEAAGGLGPFLIEHLDGGRVRESLAGGARRCACYRPYSWALQHPAAE